MDNKITEETLNEKYKRTKERDIEVATYVNPITSDERKVKIGISWTVFFFGAVALLFRREYFLAFLILFWIIIVDGFLIYRGLGIDTGLLPYTVAWMIYSFFANAQLEKKLIKEGYVLKKEKGSNEEELADDKVIDNLDIEHNIIGEDDKIEFMEKQKKKKRLDILWLTLSILLIAILSYDIYNSLAGNTSIFEQKIEKERVSQAEYDEMVSSYSTAMYGYMVGELSTVKKNGSVSKGDVIEASWESYLDDERYIEGNSDGKQKFLIGSSFFDENAEKHFINMEVGDTVKIEIEYDSSNDNLKDELTGQTWYAVVTVYNIYESATDEQITTYYNNEYATNFKNIKDIKEDLFKRVKEWVDEQFIVDTSINSI